MTSQLYRDAGQEFAIGERLDDVIVGSYIEASHTLVRLVERRNDDDRHIMRRAGAELVC